MTNSMAMHTKKRNWFLSTKLLSFIISPIKGYVSLVERLELQNSTQGNLINCYKKLVRSQELRIQRLTDRYQECCQELANAQPIEVYHQGEDNLFSWINQFDCVRQVDGKKFSCTPLMYVHKSGHAAFLTLDPNTGECGMCIAPEGGLQPNPETLQFAHEWLYRTNILQDGNLLDRDINHSANNG